MLAGRRPILELDYRTESGDGPRWHNMSVVPMIDPTLGVLVTHTDVTWRKRREDDLTHRANHDDLTGLPNRTYLNDELGRAIARANRTGVPMALLFLDLDHFKSINDRYGHEAGDRVLHSVAQRLLHAVRPTDLVARLGGDEFVVLADEIGDVQRAAEIARRLLSACEAPIEVDGHHVLVTPSIGLVLSPPRRRAQRATAGRGRRHVPGQGVRPGPIRGVGDVLRPRLSVPRRLPVTGRSQLDVS